MTVVTIEIDSERDLAAVEEFLIDKGLKFEVEDDDDWGDLPPEAIEGIEAGLADAEAGRTHSHEYVMNEIDKIITEFREKNGG